MYGDVVCPFTHVGLHHLVARCAELGRTDIRIRVHAWPLELVNGHPLDPHLVAHEIEALRGGVDAALFAGFDQLRFPSTSLPALELAELAYAQSDETGTAMSLALRDELFMVGRDISDPVVLRTLADRFEIGEPTAREREAVLQDWRAGQARGVHGSPHYFSGAVEAFCPWLDITQVDGSFTVRTNRQVFEDFLSACLSA